KRSSKSQCRYLWLADEQFAIIPTRWIRNQVKVWLIDQPEPNEYEYFVDEIVYQHNNRSWKVRPIQYRHWHPSETMVLPPIPSGFRCLRIFIDLYYDDFETFRDVYHSLGFVPLGANFEDFIKPFIADMRQLQNSIQMSMYNGEKVYIKGGLEVVTADLPQGNNLCGVKRYNANRGCRNIQFSEIRSQRNFLNKMKVAAEYGLCLKKNILDLLYRDRHQQYSQDLYYAMAGKVKKLLEYMITLFNDEGVNIFLKMWKSIELPKSWSKLPNPITHQKSFMMPDLFRLAMLMPHILNCFLTIKHIKENALNDLWKTIKCKHRVQVINLIIKCWVSLSLSIKQSFAISFLKDNNFETLKRTLKKEHDYLIK
ncbi:12059_t:CDS:2, partial [Racocetra persica]